MKVPVSISPILSILSIPVHSVLPRSPRSAFGVRCSVFGVRVFRRFPRVLCRLPFRSVFRPVPPSAFGVRRSMFGVRFRRRLRRFAAVTACLLLVSALAFLSLWHAFPFPLDRLDRLPPSTRVLAADGALIRGYIAEDDQWRFPLDYDQFSPWLIAATVAVEDGRFWDHRGVDPRAAARAAWQNLTHLRTVSGASTITMQVCRLIDNRPRDPWNKAVESFRALQLERLLSKRQILAAYLNRAPYGSNLRGAEAASLRWFGKHAADLTLAEAALLAGLPQSPTRFRPDRHLDRALVRQRFVLAELRRRAAISEDQYQTALAQPISVTAHPLPLRAPHFCDLALQKCTRYNFGKTPLAYWNQGKINVPGTFSGEIRTTLDLRVQTLAERAVREQVARHAARGVTNGAAVVIENQTGAVIAMVGSIDYRDSDAGRVNAAMSLRSPGSALKPFTYALAFDAGLATPSTVLADTPIRFAGYDPENYDRQFRGPVPAAEALTESLNIPALALAKDLGVPRLRQFLDDAGLTTLTRPPDQYGLPLTLGACDVRLLELTNAYAALARLGEFRPYRLECGLPNAECEIEGSSIQNPKSKIQNAPPLTPARRVLTPGAAYLVTQALADRARLERAVGLRDGRAMPTVAWKTGTSTGRRDAWTFAYNPDYTVGVWLGNFDGRASPALVGAELAAPVAFEVFQGLYRDRPWPWYEVPPDVAMHNVCTISGEPAAPDCPAVRPAPCLPGRSAARTCSIHRRILVDADTGHLLCPLCSTGRHAVWRPATIYPPALAAWLVAHHQSLPALPTHNPRCTAIAPLSPPRERAGVRGTEALSSLPPSWGRAGVGAMDSRNAITILSPADGQQFVLLRDRPAADQQIELRAALPADSAAVFWFADGRLVARSGNVGQPPPAAIARWPLSLGRHELRCVDSLGRSASLHVTVE